MSDHSMDLLAVVQVPVMAPLPICHVCPLAINGVVGGSWLKV